MNHFKFQNFRNLYPTFTYTSFHYEISGDLISIQFFFEINTNIKFSPIIRIPMRKFYSNISAENLDRLIFRIGLIELISYWKSCCPPIIIIKAGQLSPQELNFWKKIYWHGLGEFFYINHIETSFEKFLNIECQYTDIYPLNIEKNHEFQYIVPIGGGKDSVVTLELLRKTYKIIPMIINPRGATIATIEAAGFTLNDCIIIHRNIDTKLLELNKSGYLNGHTPFSAMLAFYTALMSVLTGIENIALSNESSANESTVVGSEINHQYSKTFEFESDFRQYTQTYLYKNLNYFSFLRPLSELSIAKLFTQYSQYHFVFKSCNVGSKTDIWCGKCPKCLFAYIIISPFIDTKTMNAIFGHDLLDDPDLEFYFKELCGLTAVKPFECVGTIEEVYLAMNQLILKIDDHRYLVEKFRQFPPIALPDFKSYISAIHEPHHLTLNLLNILKMALK